MRKHLALVTTLGWALTAPAIAQDGALSPHVGGKVTTAFSNHFGPDAESTLTFLSVQPDSTVIGYESSRGLSVQRTILARDQASARKYVLGYAANMRRQHHNPSRFDVLERLRYPSHQIPIAVDLARPCRSTRP
jgi:hypothetical protein